MTEAEWKDRLQTYASTPEVVRETLSGVVEHVEMKCQVPALLIPAIKPVEECDRGTTGCTLVHNDKLALQFARLALERIQELESGDDPMPEVETARKEVR